MDYLSQVQDSLDRTLNWNHIWCPLMTFHKGTRTERSATVDFQESWLWDPANDSIFLHSL